MDKNKEIFLAAVKALYGPRWQTELARKLQVDNRTARKWAAAKMPKKRIAQIKRLLIDRACEIEGLIQEIEEIELMQDKSEFS